MPVLSTSPNSAFASCSRAVSTVCGISPTSAGPKNDSQVPNIAASTASIQISAVPVSSSAAIVAWTTARPRSATSIVSRRPKRSATLPPGIATTRNGSDSAAVTIARSDRSPIASTANGSAMNVMRSPMTERT